MGNTTFIMQPRHWLPCSWGHTDFAAGQTTGIPMAINGFPPGVDAFSLPRRVSIVTVGVELDAAITAGFIRFQLSSNGVGVGSTLDMDPSHGRRRLIELPPGRIVGSKGQRIGMLWGSNGSMAPSGSIDGVILLEVEPV